MSTNILSGETDLNSLDLAEMEEKDFRLLILQNMKALFVKAERICDNQDCVSRKLDSLEKKMNNFDVKLTEQGKSIEFAHAEIKDLRNECKQMATMSNGLKSTTEKQSQNMCLVQDRVNNLERKQKERNIRIVGIEEKKDENVQKTVCDLLSHHFKLDDVEIEDAYRFGTKGVTRNGKQLPRHIVVTMKRAEDRLSIMRSKGTVLKDEDFFITDDLIDADRRRRDELKPVMEKARKDGKKVVFKHGKLYINNQVYREPNKGPVSPSVSETAASTSS